MSEVKEEIGVFTHVDDEGNEIQLYPMTKQIVQSTNSVLSKSHAGSIKINEVLGNCEQTQYTGRNLIPYPYYETTHEDNGITFTDNGDGSVTIDGTATGDSQFMFMSRHDDTMTLKAGTYTISGGCPKGGSTSTYRLIVSKKDAEGVASKIGYDLGEGLTFDVDGTETAIGVVMFINSGTTVSNLVVRPQLELGSVATDYEPYVGGIPSPNPDYPQEIQSVEVSEIKAHGKNVLDLSTFTITNTSVTIDEVDLETGYAKVTFENAATQGAAYSTKFSLVDSETYIFSANAIAQDRGITIAIQVVEAEAGTWVTNYKAGVSFTASSEYMYRFIIQNNTGTKYSGTVEVDSIQLELGDAATDYEPYQESVVTLSEAVTLHGINDVKDRIVRKDGVMCIERNLAEVVLDGSDEITYKKNDESEDIYLYLAQVSCGINTPCLCDKLSNRSISTLVAENGNTAENSGISSGNKYENIYVNVGYIMSENTLDAFKAWLTENPLTVVYVPTEPTYESLPVADQIALNGLESFDTVTYISTDSEVEAVVDVDYAVDKVGSLTLENDNLIETNRILIDTALPYTIEIDDEAQTINFIDR